MKGRNVHIAKLRLRIPRGRAGEAAEIARGLGRQILLGIADSSAAGGAAGHLDALGPVRVRTKSGRVIADLADEATMRITQRLRAPGDGDSHG